MVLEIQPLQLMFSELYCLHCTVLHCTALHCTALNCTALHCTALHYTALCFVFFLYYMFYIFFWYLLFYVFFLWFVFFFFLYDRYFPQYSQFYYFAIKITLWACKYWQSSWTRVTSLKSLVCFKTLGIRLVVQLLQLLFLVLHQIQKYLICIPVVDY